MSARLAITLTALLMPLGACAAAAVGTAGAVGLAGAQERTLGEAVDDATTSNEIKARLLAQGRGYGEVDVEVAGGLVLLSGRVNTPDERVRAEKIAWSVERTRDVANEIRIEPPGGFVANVSDELVTARVRSRLLGSSSVRSINFNVETYDGVVYLMGLARSEKELRAAAEEAARAGGVKQVVSYIRIRDREPAGTPYHGPADGAYNGQAAAEPDLFGGR